MAYIAPTTQITGALITASIWNTDLVDNIEALKDPPSDAYTLNEGSDYSTTSTSFTDIDATNLAMTLTTTGGVVEVIFAGNFKHSTSGAVYLNLAVDGTPHATDDGPIGVKADSTAPGTTIPLLIRIPGLSAAEHTIKLQWKVNSGTANLFAGAGTTNADFHPEFYAVER